MRRLLATLITMVILFGPTITRAQADLPPRGIMSLSPDQQTLAIYEPGTRSIGIWDVPTQKKIRSIQIGGSSVNSLAWSKDQRQVAVSESNAQVMVYAVATGQLSQKMKVVESSIFQLAFGPNDRLYGGNLGGLYCWDSTNGELLRMFNDDGKIVNAFAISPDGFQLATIGTSNVIIWDARSGNSLKRFKVGGTKIAWSPDGNELLTSGSINGINRVMVATGKIVKLSTNDSSGLNYSPNGKFVAIGEYQPDWGIVHILETETWKEVKTFQVVSKSPAGFFFLEKDRIVLIQGGDHWLWVHPYAQPAPREPNLSTS